jgi:hypothetical protein
MTTSTSPAGAQRVECSVCLREIPRSEAIVPEASDYVAYFCGLECYEQWKSDLATRAEAGAPAPAAKPQEPAMQPEIQLGRNRGRAMDDRLKRAVKQHPQRDEPRVDSVEPYETPPT